MTCGSSSKVVQATANSRRQTWFPDVKDRPDRLGEIRRCEKAGSYNEGRLTGVVEIGVSSYFPPLTTAENMN
jgi:hypothetical protein